MVRTDKDKDVHDTCVYTNAYAVVVFVAEGKFLGLQGGYL